jgi:hypothetical protein
LPNDNIYFEHQPHCPGRLPIVREHLPCLDSCVNTHLPALLMSSCCKSSGSIRRSMQLSLAWTSAFQIGSILTVLNYIRLHLNLSTHWQFIWG